VYRIVKQKAFVSLSSILSDEVCECYTNMIAINTSLAKSEQKHSCSTKRGPVFLRTALLVTVLSCISTIWRFDSSLALSEMVAWETVQEPEAKHSDQDEERERERPTIQKFFAMHIGPSKTGTSAIQKDMAKNPFEQNTFASDKDNLIYTGKRFGHDWPDPNLKKTIRRDVPLENSNKTKSVSAKSENKAYFRATNCMLDLLDDFYESNNNTSNKLLVDQRLESDDETRLSLRQSFLENCWIQNGIDFSYMLNSSIVTSDEAYSYGTHVKKIKKKIQIFDILGYERLVVVGAYRRYAEWIVSAYTQLIKKICIYPSREGRAKDRPCQKLSKFLYRYTEQTETSVRTYQSLDITLPKIMAKAPSKLEAKILNYFQLQNSGKGNENPGYKSITTELYCDAFASLTPHTCANAKDVEMKKEKSSSLVANKGGISDSVYQQIVAAAYWNGFLVLRDEELENKKEQCQGVGMWCAATRRCTKTEESCTLELQELDKITSGRNIRIVGTNTSNITTYQELASYHTGVHKRTWTESLPIVCPKRSQLEQLLEKSLAMEKRLMPDFYDSPMGKEEHIRLFWDVWLKKKRLFCWVDTDRLFEGADSWDVIINERMVNHDWGEPRVEQSEREIA